MKKISFFISIIFFFSLVIIISCKKNNNNKDDFSKIETEELKKEKENQEINQLIAAYDKLKPDKKKYYNKISSDHPFVKNKIIIKDQIKSFNENTKKVILFGFGDSVTCSTRYGKEGVVTTTGYFTQLADELENINEKKTIATDTSVIQNHYDSLKNIKNPYSKDTYGIIVFTTLGNNFLHPFGIAGIKGGNSQHFKLPKDLEVNEAELFGISLIQLKEIYGPLLRNYLELIYKELKRIFPGGFHLFIANIYDPTDGTGKFEEIHFSGKKNRLPPRKEGLDILNYINKNIIADFSNSHINSSLVDSRKALFGYGITKWGTNEYCYMESIFEDPNELGSKKIKNAFLKSLKKNLPNEIKKMISLKN